MKKVCFLTPRFPFPENGGDVLRINNIARYLKKNNYELILISFYEKEIHLNDEYYNIYDSIFLIKRSKILSFFMSLFFALTGRPIQCGYYYSFKFLKQLKKIIAQENPDIFISHLLRMTPYLDVTHQQNKSIIEMTDALSKTYMLSAEADGSFIKKVIYKIEFYLIKRYEKYVVLHFPKVVLVSKTDIQYLDNICQRKNDNLFLYTNGVDVMSSRTVNFNKRNICFIGNMRTLQNQDAVLNFCKNILPIIKKKVPDVLFTVIGAEPPESIKSLADGKSIIVTGFVDDIQTAISECCLAVAPVRVAAGIQNKVLVAMGCGVPVVMTSLISEAIPELVDGENCFISENKQDFAEKCISLLCDMDLRNKISIAGYDTVKNHYNWDCKLAGYENI